MNILTYDIEEWFAEDTMYGNRKEMYDIYDRFLYDILSLLECCGKKATFFCVGGLVPKYSYVIRQIAEKGHEIGCHSNHHQFLNKMTYDAVLEDTRTAIDSIEQVIGKKVLSYRAPAFSIGESNKWAFELLAKCGIKRDASIYPAARDLGGFPNFGVKEPCIIEYDGIQMKEFPVCTAKAFGKEMAYSGGGYFRFFPLWYIKREIMKSPYSMCYFHINDLLPELRDLKSKSEYEAYYKEPGTLKNRYMRYIKTNLGKKGAFKKMTSLIDHTTFINLAAADTQIDWEKVPHISL